MNVSEQVNGIRKRWRSRFDKEPVDWITVNGNHIPIDENKKPVGGQLKALGIGTEHSNPQNRGANVGGTVDKTAEQSYNNIGSNSGEPIEEKRNQGVSSGLQRSSVRDVDDDTINSMARHSGKSPDEVKKFIKDLRSESVHNMSSDTMMLGKGHNGGPDSYVNRAEREGNTYFSMGDRWERTKEEYGLSDQQMFEIFNAAAIDLAISNGKTVRFCDKPKNDGSGLSKELRYLQKNYGVRIKQKGDYWYAER